MLNSGDCLRHDFDGGPPPVRLIARQISEYGPGGSAPKDRGAGGGVMVALPVESERRRSACNESRACPEKSADRPVQHSLGLHPNDTERGAGHAQYALYVGTRIVCFRHK